MKFLLDNIQDEEIEPIKEEIKTDSSSEVEEEKKEMNEQKVPDGGIYARKKKVVKRFKAKDRK